MISAIINAGLTPPDELIGDGKLHRFAGNGDARKKNSWYVYYDDGFPAGSFGDWKTGLQESWASKTTSSMSPEEKTRHKARMEASRVERKAAEDDLHAECREKSASMWQAARDVSADHPYVARKQITPYAARQLKDMLLVPVVNRQGTIHGLQIIQPDGTKKFKIGTVKEGRYCLIGSMPVDTIAICEGWATGCSIHEATGITVMVAFDAGNMEKVARLARVIMPTADIVIAADNDIYGATNTGITRGASAARAINGRLAYPVFTDTTTDSKPTDFNDLHVLSGIDAVATQFHHIHHSDDGIPPTYEEMTGPTAEDINEIPPPDMSHINQSPAEITLALVESLNVNHFVSREAGKTYVFSEQWDARMGRNVLLRSSFQDFINYHANRMVFSHDDKKGNPVYKSLGDVWLTHGLRRQYSGITLEPGKVTPGMYNLWRGFAVEAKRGTWDLMQDHIFEVVCQGDTVLYQYVLGWLATAVQKPGVQAETALVMRGKRGTGKGTLGNYMCRIFGGNSAHIMNSKYLTGNFNSHLRDVVFMFADEAFWAGDKSGESVLKGIITEPTLTIEGKGRDVVFTRNMLHIMMASNNDWVVPAGLEERRFCVCDVSDKYMQDKKYFGKIYRQMDNGGVEAMLYDLENMDLSTFDIRTVPQTAGLFEQKLQSLDPLMAWWFGKLTDGYIYQGEEWGKISTQRIYASYIETMVHRSINHRAAETQIGYFLRKVLPDINGLKQRELVDVGGARASFYYLPHLDLCRKHFESLVKHEITW